MQGPRLSRRRIAPSSLRPWWLLGALVSWVSPAQAQLGGTCAEAISVLPSSVTEGPPAHAGTQLETIWYKLSGTGRSVLVDAESTGTRPRIVAYEGDCSELEARGSWLPPFSFVIATVAGGRHFINVARWPSVTYTLRLTELSRPANDDCEDSIVLDLTSQNPVEVEGTNLSATTEGSRMSMGAPGVWYRVIGNGHRFRASICDDSNFTPSVVVFRGYCDNLQRLDTSTPFQCTRPSSVAEWPSAPGQVYSILVEGMIDAHGPAQGVFKLSVSFIVPPPADCDRDGISDADEIRAGAIDCDRNLIPDSCELATTARFGPVQDWFVNAYEHPVAVIASDFDGDGRQDLAAASVESFDDRVPAAPGVLVLRNAPATGFTLVQALKVPALVSGRSIFSPRLVAADLDGDHHVDLALTGGKYPAVAILRNLGDGHMEPSGVYDKETSSEEAIRFLGRGDLDLDGDVDLFTTEENHTRIRILWNDGHARFDAAGFIPVDRMPLADAVAADLDGDGQTDLAALAALSPGDRVVQVLRNDGGAFSPASRLALDPEIRAAGSLAVADLNRDGTLDVVTVAEGIFASFLNLGRGAWSERRDHDIAGRGEGAPHLAGIATGDFDRDGDVDAAAAGGRFVFIAYNSGSGSLERGENPRVTGYPSCVASADFDDDGHQEIASTNSVPGALSVLWQSKEALSDVYKEQLILALGRPTALVTRDLDGDGDEDLVAASEGRTGGKAFFNRGDASFQEQAAFLEGRSLKAVAVEDFTGDGSPDVAATLGDGTSIALLPSLGLGQDPEPATLDAGVPCDGLVAGDLDRDEDFDLVAWSAAVREIRSFRNDGREPDGQSAWRLAATTRTALKPMVVSLGDLDGDGILDLIAGLDSDPPGPQYAILGSLYVWKGVGDGSFALWYSQDEIGNQAVALLAGDLDADGDIDAALILGQSTGLHLNDGTGVLHAGDPLHPDDAPRFLAQLDFDGDGDEDLAALSAYSWSLRHRVSIHSNEGGGAFVPTTHSDAPGARELFGMVTGDWDADGDRDVAVLGQWLHEVDRSPDRWQSAIRIIANDRYPADSKDKDKDGRLDACQGYFYRGDMNGDGKSDVSDAAFLNAYLFLGGGAPGCFDAADANNDGRLDISDGIHLLGYLFLGGRPVPFPGYPGTGAEDPPRSCGRDPEGGDLGCTAYRACRRIDF